jgi:DNA-binding MurR/RpiR family transcriptional regulator
MFRDRIKSAYTDLSPSFQRLGDFLMDHSYEAAFMTATQLGKALDVDTATVVRFAQRLGYPGYPELLGDVQAEVKEQLARYFTPTASGDSMISSFRATVRQAVSSVEQFDLGVSDQTIERIVDLIDGVDRIWLIGEAMSRIMIELLGHYLLIMGYNVQRLPLETSTVAVRFRSLNAKDLVMAMAFTPYNPDTTSALHLARARGARTVGFVGAASWPVARAAEVTVLCPNKSVVGLTLSPVVYSVAIDAVIQALIFKHRGTLAATYVEYEDSLRQLGEFRSQFVTESFGALPDLISKPEPSSESAPSDE